MLQRDRLFIGGDWVLAANTLPVFNPATEEKVGYGPCARADDVDAAVAAARAVADDGHWSSLTPIQRADVLDTVCEAIEPKLGSVAQTVTAEMGLPITMSDFAHRTQPARLWKYATELARRVVVAEQRGESALILREPVGVVAAIAPWNAPFLQAMYKVVYPLLAGCPVILKPAPETPLDCFAIAEAFEEVGAPRGLLSIVPGGAEIGEHLVRHRGVDKVSFTGSSATGRRIGGFCGGDLKRISMELGGRSAAIVLDDASVTAAVNGIVAGSFGNSGQMCVATSRVLISERLYDDVVEGVRARARDLIVGDPLNPSTEIGPLVAKRQRDRVDDLVRMAIDDGAESVAGSSFADRFPRGWFYEPTVLVNVKNTATIAQEEVFGPVVTFTTFKTDDEALSMANDSVYGLHGAVYTRDEARALDVARRVRTGSFSVNGFFTSFEMPFGGVKASGIGRKFGPEGLDAYFELKTVHNLTLAV